MRLPQTNSTVSIKRRTITTGDKKQSATIQTGIEAYIGDYGTTADHEQSYLIMLNAEDVTSTINPDTDVINDGTDNYKIANSGKRTYHYQLRCIKAI